MGYGGGSTGSLGLSLYKKRKISKDRDYSSSLPILRSHDYFIEPCLKELAYRELADPGYCSRVPNFTVGRYGYGCIEFHGDTDVRWLDLDQIVRFERHEVVVYEDEASKPVVGQGLNKAADVTLVLQVTSQGFSEKPVNEIVKKLRVCTDRQGARFISFDPCSFEWKFSVHHFSRFGLSDDDEDDVIIDDSFVVQRSMDMSGDEVLDVDEETEMDISESGLSQSLPAHLGLDPVKMREMRMVLFSPEDDDAEEVDKLSRRRVNHRSSPGMARKTPLPMIEYNSNALKSSSPGNILLSQQNKGIPKKITKRRGFELDLEHETPVSGSHSRNVVDAALFMGRSFRVGWGPNGVLVHTGAPVGSNVSPRVLSSVINIEKVAIDRVVRDENNDVRKELGDLCFDSPLNLHNSINHETKEVDIGGSFKLKLQKPVSNRFMLPEICRSYTGIIERQLEVPGLSSSARVILNHQGMIWELIKVLFSVKEVNNEEDMMHDRKEDSNEPDPEALPYIRRAEFSCWLQEIVYRRVQEEISGLGDSSDLEQIFLLLTGRQVDTAVELAASRGDVRLACLLTQAGGSTMNRVDLNQQLDLWRTNGLDFNFIEKDRARLYELLAGNIHGALHGKEVDWKRFLGLLMWYQLPPDTSLSDVFHTYQELLHEGRAPYPVPIYIDEGPSEEAVDRNAEERFDFAYYLMLLHASEEDCGFDLPKSMFSAFSSTHDPLDHHMIWHQRSVLEAVGVLSCNDLHVLDMGIVSQLLCLGKCHWAIYVVLHMPYNDDYPYLQAMVIREILFQHCESWSSDEVQRQYIEDLGVPLTWMHEAMGVYFQYNRNVSKALEHFVECANWQQAHSIFITSVAHSLFLTAKHSEIWRISTSMEDHKSGIEDWDLGAGIYISFYLLRNSLQEDSNTMSELYSLESKDAACRDFFSRLNDSVAVRGVRLALEARVVYSKMAAEISSLLLSDSGEGSTREIQLSCFSTTVCAPLPEDIRSSYLQGAVSLFTFFLSEAAIAS